MASNNNDPYRDEDGEPLMDPDMASDGEPSPQPYAYHDDEEDWGRERSPTPVMDSDAVGLSMEKPRKRLVKKSGGAVNEIEVDFDEARTPKRKKEKEKGMGGGKKEKRFKKDKGLKTRSKEGSLSSNDAGDREMKEMKELWDTIAGAESEDDQEGVRNVDDDAFIDDSGVDPADRFGSDNEAGSVGDAPQAEEGEEDEIKQLFNGGKKKKKSERTAAEIALLVEHLMAELEVTAEEDAELNRQCKPAINKLKKLSLLTEVLSKKQLQHEFLDHGVLTLLKNWLEPLPDGSLPNINIRTAVLNILTDFPIDLEQYDRKEQLKRSGLGKVIMFLSRTDEETMSNRKLAKDLVDKWSRPIFNKSTRYEDMRSIDDERIPYRKPLSKKPITKATGLESRDDDLEFSQEPKSVRAANAMHTTRPEALPLDFLVRPQSKVDPDEVRARAKSVHHDQHRIKVNKKLQNLKAPKKKQLQATKLSVEGRGMIKFF